jgi:hypothetical protein
MDPGLPIYASQVARFTGVHHHTFFFFFLLRWGLINFLSGLAWNHNPQNLCLQSVWDYRSESTCPAVLSVFINSPMGTAAFWEDAGVLSCFFSQDPWKSQKLGHLQRGSPTFPEPIFLPMEGEGYTLF